MNTSDKYIVVNTSTNERVSEAISKEQASEMVAKKLEESSNSGSSNQFVIQQYLCG